MNYTETEIRSSTRYPCGAIVARPGKYNSACKRQAVLLFKDGETVKACACQQHRDTMRKALATVPT